MKKIFLLILPALLLASCMTEKAGDQTAGETPSDINIVTLDSGVKVEYRDGLYIYQGDIVLSEEQLAILGSASTRGYAMDNFAKTWSNGVVYYTTAAGFSKTTDLQAAIAHWQENTDITFVPRNGQPDYVEFQSVAAMYSEAPVGRALGKQTARISNYADTPKVIHLLGHVVGLMHEHSRADRNDFVTIYPDNMLPYANDMYYQINSDGRTYEDFDYNSIMLLGSYEYSFWGEPTMTKKDGSLLPTNTGLSQQDIETVNWLYNEYQIPPSTTGNVTITYDGDAQVTVGDSRYVTATYDNAACTNALFYFSMWREGDDEAMATGPETGFTAHFSQTGTYHIGASVANEGFTGEKTIQINVIGPPGEVILDYGPEPVQVGENRYIVASYYNPAIPSPVFNYSIFYLEGQEGQEFDSTTGGIYYTFDRPGTYSIHASVENAPGYPSVSRTVTVGGGINVVYGNWISTSISSSRYSGSQSNRIDFYYDENCTQPVYMMPFSITATLTYYEETEHQGYGGQDDYIQQNISYHNIVINAGDAGSYPLWNTYWDYNSWPKRSAYYEMPESPWTFYPTEAPAI